MLRKEIVDKIILKLINEEKIYQGTYKDSQSGMIVINETINLKVNSIAKSLAAAANSTQGLEWSSYGSNNKNVSSMIKIHKKNDVTTSIYQDIPASEAYACIVESMYKISEEYTEQMLLDILDDVLKCSDLNTKLFLARVKEYSMLLIRQNLISWSKKNSKGKLIGREVADMIHQDDEGNEISFIESQTSTTAGTRDVVIELFGGDYHDSRVDWIVENLDSIFTKNQCEYLRGTKKKEMNSKDVYKIKKNMQKRLLNALEKEFGSINNRLISIRRDMKKIEKVLESENFIAAIFKNTSKKLVTEGKETIIDNALSEYCNPSDMKKFINADIKTHELCKPLRVALYKKLGDLIEAEEKWINYNPEPLKGTELVKVYNDDNEVVAMVTAKEKEKIYQESLIYECVSYKDDSVVQNAIMKLESKNKKYKLWFSNLVTLEKSEYEFEKYNKKEKK